MKQFNIVVSDRFNKMQGEHLRFIAKVSMAAADKTHKDILSALSSLSTLPERYPFLSDEAITANKFRKLYVGRWYVILYQIIGETVYVDYIIDCRQDYSWLAK